VGWLVGWLVELEVDWEVWPGVSGEAVARAAVEDGLGVEPQPAAAMTSVASRRSAALRTVIT
jgi:hypothetical protein